jgi:hypothetical protein
MYSMSNMSCVIGGDDGAKVFPGEYETVFQDNAWRRRTATLTLGADGRGAYIETLGELCVSEQSSFSWSYSGSALRFTDIKIRQVQNCDQKIFALEYASQPDEAAKVKNPNKCHFEMEILESSKDSGFGWFIWEAAGTCTL